MSTPLIGAQRFAISCLLGCLLGVYYGFLRPLRPKALGDGLFLLGFGWVWLYQGFGVCKGDLRLIYTAGLLLGAILWMQTCGTFLQPVFTWFWTCISNIFSTFFRALAKFFKKIIKFIKNLFPSGKKWGTIYGNISQHLRRKSGGDPHGKATQSLEPDSAGLPAQFPASQMRGSGNHRTVYSRTDYP